MSCPKRFAEEWGARGGSLLPPRLVVEYLDVLP
jgi:hypothetical protein